MKHYWSMVLFPILIFLSVTGCDSFITDSDEQDELRITVLQQEVEGTSQFQRVEKARITLTAQNLVEFTKYDAVKVNVVHNRNLIINPTADSQKDLDANNITAVMYFLTESYHTRGLYIRKNNYESMPDFSQEDGTYAMFPFFITEAVPAELTFIEFELKYTTAGTEETIDTMRIYMSRAEILEEDDLVQKNADELNITYNTNPDHNRLFFNFYSEFDYALMAPVALCWLNTDEGTFLKTEIIPGSTSELTSSVAFNSYEFNHIDFFALAFKDDVWE